jgi:hypothetical protein
MRFLYHLPAEFEGFTPGAAWEDLRVGLRHMRRFQAIALVTDVAWIREAMRLFAFAMPCPLRVFPDAGYDDAVRWLAQAPAPGALSHRIVDAQGVLLLEPHGPLRASDFDAVDAEADAWIEAHGPLRGIVIHAAQFPGWEDLGSLLRHVRFVRDHEKDVARIGLAVGGRMASVAPQVGKHFVSAEVKTFGEGEVERAIAWAGEVPAHAHA